MIMKAPSSNGVSPNPVEGLCVSPLVEEIHCWI